MAVPRRMLPALGGLAAVMCGAWIDPAAASPPPAGEPAPEQRADQRIEQYLRAAPAGRREAEAALRRAGRAAAPAVARRLAEERDPDARRRLAALAAALDADDVAVRLAEPTRITAAFRDQPAVEVIRNLAARVGWTVVDRRAVEPDKTTLLSLAFDETPVLEALSQACAQAGCVWRIRPGERLHLESVDAGCRPPEAFAGPFMMRLTQVRRDFDLAGGSAAAVWGLELQWEPKVDLLAVDAHATPAAVWDSTGADLRLPSPGPALKTAQRTQSVPVTLVTAAPSPGAGKLDRLEFTVAMVVIGRTERMEIRPLDPGRTYTLIGRRSGIPITVRPAQEVSSRWQVQVAVGQGESEVHQDLIAQGFAVTPTFELTDSAGKALSANWYWQGRLIGEPVFNLYHYRNGDSRPAALAVELPVSFYRHAVRFRLEGLSLGR